MKIATKLKAYSKWIGMFSIVFCLSGCAVTEQKNRVLLLMSTSMGDVQIELYPDKAPLTVSNFLRYVDAGGYQGGSFYRVVRADNDKGDPQITVIQGGAKEGFKEWPAIELETTDKTGISHLDGTLSMARAEPDTATTAFFICIGRQPSLDFGGKRAKDGLGFAAFGKVVKGMEIVKAINAITKAKPTDYAYMKGQMLAEPVVIERIVRL